MLTHRPIVMAMEKSHNCWYAYLSVPADVRDKIGKRRFYKSLETDQKDRATISHLNLLAVKPELYEMTFADNSVK